MAQGIAYTGKAGGYDVGRDGSLAKADSAYVEFTRNAHKRRCDIVYKRSSKMQYDSGTLMPGTPITFITVDTAAQAQYAQDHGAIKKFYKLFSPQDKIFEQANLPLDQQQGLDYATGVQTNALSAKGKMHSVWDVSIDYFNV